MDKVKIPKRITTALINSLTAGVVPRVGLEFITVGRRLEIETLLKDIDNISEGGASFRFIIGRYGSGKSFLLQAIRNYAMEKNYIVADADLSPERKLVGNKGQGLATYRELMRNLSTKTRPDGGALSLVLDRWISEIQSQVVKDTGLRPGDSAFDSSVEQRIFDVISGMEEMVHGFDFAAVLSAYWKGYRQSDDNLKNAALRWLRGEYSTKLEAREALDVRVIIDDDTWYEYIKLMASFTTSIGYKGFIVIIDEGVNLYKIMHTVSRQSNYEKLLTMFNDTMQGKAKHLGILLGGTPQFLEDQRRGLYSYEALRSRLAESRFARPGLNDLQGPVIRLNTLTHDEIYVLLTRLVDIHSAHYQYDTNISSQDLIAFMQIVSDRMGADAMLTPREVVRDFISVLNLLQQNPDITMGQLINGEDFKFSPSMVNNENDIDEKDEFSEFTL